MIRVALIDDHESVRLGLEAAIMRDGSAVVFSGVTVDAYLEWSAMQPAGHETVVVLDLTLGDSEPIKRNVRRLLDDGANVIIHSVADRPAAVREALSAGALGVISKSAPTGDVLAAIRTVAGGNPLNNVEWATIVEADSEFADAQLSQREREVLRLYASGLPLKLVASQLGIAFSTAKENISRVRTKYIDVGRPAPTKVELLMRAMEDGLIDESANGSGG